MERFFLVPWLAPALAVLLLAMLCSCLIASYWWRNRPTNAALDAVSPQNPVFLAGLHGFAAWANQKALELAGINTQTPDPENGKILRDAQGRATGILLNRAQELVAKKIPPLTLDQAKHAIELAAQECVRNGLTSVHEALVSRLELQAFREQIGRASCRERVYVLV